MLVVTLHQPTVWELKGPGKGAAAFKMRRGGLRTGICNEHGTIYVVSSDFGDQMKMQSMGLMILLREHI